MAETLDVPLNYFFCEDDSTAELACLISKMSRTEKEKLIEQLIKNKDTYNPDDTSLISDSKQVNTNSCSS